MGVLAFAPEGDALGTSEAGQMPSGRELATTVSDGTSIYIFGGFGGAYRDEILKFDPASGQVTTMAARLPGARSAAAGVWTGSAIYLFGGTSPTWGAPEYVQILRYDPASDAITVLATSLPKPLSGANAVWTGTYAYVFGGSSGGGSQFYSDILRFDPVTEQVVKLGVSLPSPRNSFGLAWTGAYVYLFGGHDGGWLDQIVRFDPDGEQVVVMGSHLPAGRGSFGASWDGLQVHLFGGSSAADNFMSEILDYTPAVDLVLKSQLSLPQDRTNIYVSVASVDGKAYIVGGRDAGSNHASILRYDGLLPPATLQAYP